MISKEKQLFFNPRKDSRCEDETSLSIENLTEDMVSFYEEVVQHLATVIIGHSMGGALAVHVSHRTPCIGLVGSKNLLNDG